MGGNNAVIDIVSVRVFQSTMRGTYVEAVRLASP
jgi:hypothetical protein